MTESISFDQLMELAERKLTDQALEIKHDVAGVEFTFRFWPKYPAEAAPLLAQFQRLAALGVNADAGEQHQAIVNFLDMMATEETNAQIGALMARKIVGTVDLVHLQRKIMEALAQRPFENSPSLPDLPSPTGHTSMVGAQLGVSIP